MAETLIGVSRTHLIVLLMLLLMLHLMVIASCCWSCCCSCCWPCRWSWCSWPAAGKDSGALQLSGRPHAPLSPCTEAHDCGLDFFQRLPAGAKQAARAVEGGEKVPRSAMSQSFQFSEAPRFLEYSWGYRGSFFRPPDGLERNPAGTRPGEGGQRESANTCHRQVLPPVSLRVCVFATAPNSASPTAACLLQNSCSEHSLTTPASPGRRRRRERE